MPSMKAAPTTSLRAASVSLTAKAKDSWTMLTVIGT
jgi:hypothetical protein